MARISASLLALPLALLGGCVSFGPKPPASLLSLAPTATVAAGTTRSASDKTAIFVSVPAVPQVLATQRVPVMSAGNTVAYLKGALWVETPNRLFRTVLAETIEARTGRVVPDLRSPSLSPDTRLSGSLDMFGLDAGAGQVVVRYDAVLARSGSEVSAARRFEARVPTGSEQPAAVAAALNQAANQVASEVADWIGK